MLREPIVPLWIEELCVGWRVYLDVPHTFAGKLRRFIRKDARNVLQQVVGTRIRSVADAWLPTAMHEVQRARDGDLECTWRVGEQKRRLFARDSELQSQPL